MPITICTVCNKKMLPQNVVRALENDIFYNNCYYDNETVTHFITFEK